LIASRAITLQKRREQLQLIHSRAYKARVRAAKKFEEDHSATLVDHACKPGDLVLIRNTAIAHTSWPSSMAQYSIDPQQRFVLSPISLDVIFPFQTSPVSLTYRWNVYKL